MQLTFRGVAYPATNTTVNTVNTVETKLEATYRGQNYTRCRSIIQPQLHQRNLTYRGVAYITKPQTINSVISDKALVLS